MTTFDKQFTMCPTTLDALLAEADVELVRHGLYVTVRREWIVPNEDRLSYATIIRLIECCREYHWKTDIASVTPTVDAILVRIEAHFIQPIPPRANLAITYSVTRMGRRSYDLAFDVKSSSVENMHYAKAKLKNAFYDSQTQQAVDPPSIVTSRLRELTRATEQSHDKS